MLEPFRYNADMNLVCESMEHEPTKCKALDVIKMAMAAKLMSGPKVARATPGIESAQYDESGL